MREVLEITVGELREDDEQVDPKPTSRGGYRLLRGFTSVEADSQYTHVTYRIYDNQLAPRDWDGTPQHQVWPSRDPITVLRWHTIDEEP